MDQDHDSHPDEGRLMAYLDGELSRDERANVSRHLVECDPCARSAEELRRSSEAFSEAVSALVPPAPDATAGDVRRRAGEDGGESAVAGRIGEDGSRRSAGSGWSVAARVAASVAVLLGVAAALPGSPVRGLIDRSVERVQALLGGGGPEESRTVEAPPPTAPEVEDRSGVAVAAAGGSVEIALRDVPTSTTIRVRTVDGDRAGVWNADGEYGTSPGRIEVTSPTSDELLVEVPRSVGSVRLSVNGRLALLARDGRLEVRVPGAETRNGETRFRPPGTQ